MDCPWTAISWKSWDSTVSTRVEMTGSQFPQELLTTWARFCWTMVP